MWVLKNEDAVFSLSCDASIISAFQQDFLIYEIKVPRTILRAQSRDSEFSIPEQCDIVSHIRLLQGVTTFVVVGCRQKKILVKTHKQQKLQTQPLKEILQNQPFVVKILENTFEGVHSQFIFSCRAAYLLNNELLNRSYICKRPIFQNTFQWLIPLLLFCTGDLAVTSFDLKVMSYSLSDFLQIFLYSDRLVEQNKQEETLALILCNEISGRLLR